MLSFRHKLLNLIGPYEEYQNEKEKNDDAYAELISEIQDMEDTVLKTRVRKKTINGHKNNI